MLTRLKGLKVGVQNYYDTYGKHASEQLRSMLVQVLKFDNP